MQLRKHNFRKWLKSKHPTQIVGDMFRNKCSNCPLARYLQEQTKDDKWVVGDNIYGRQYSYDGNKTLPKWAIEFVKKIDWVSDCRSFKVYARTALEILKEIS